MAACNMMQLFQTSPFSSQDRSRSVSVHRRRARHHAPSSALWRRRSGALWKCSSGKLVYGCSKASTVWVMVNENFPGRVDTTVDLGVKVSDLEFFPDILDIRYHENNRAAPPVVPYYPPSDGDGPSELDFEIYASNSMENYEPPPPPRIPFAFPFEDYYDEAIGVDYISKEEKPASSLLQFLDSLTVKKAEEVGNKVKSPLLMQSPHSAALTAEGKLGFPRSMSQHRDDGGVDSDSDGQTRGNASRPISSSAAEVNSEKSVSSSSCAMEESSEQPSVSLHMSGHEQSAGKPLNAESNTAQDFQRPLSPTVGDSGMPQARITDQPMESKMLFLLQNGISEELKGSSTASSTSSRVVYEAMVGPLYSQSNLVKEDIGNAPSAPSIRPSQNANEAHISTLLQAEPVEQIQGNSGQVLVQKIFDDGVSQSKSGQHLQYGWSAEMPDSHVNQMHEVASDKTGMPSLKNPATAAQAQISCEEIMHKSQYYEPQEGDLILGAVTFIGDQKVDLEIGAELAALMPLRDLQPLPQRVEKTFFEIPSREDGLNVPLGASLLVKDKTAFDVLSGNGEVDIGTVVLAEVTGRTIIDGRAILSCKSPAQRLAWHRLEQQCPMNNS